MHLMKEELKELLPPLGAELMRQPTLHKSLGIETPAPQHCVVEYVNARGGWYRVRFDSGLRECYKVPDTTTGPRGGRK